MQGVIERYEPTSRFWKWTLGVLRGYLHGLALEHFRRRYPGLTDEQIAERRIRSAALSAAAIGLVAGLVISLVDAVALTSALETFVSGFLSSPISIPTLALSIPLLLVTLAVEISLVVRTQIRLACDLFILYRLPADPDDPEQNARIVGVALGLSEGGVSGGKLRRAASQEGQVQPRFREWVAGQIAGQLSGRFIQKYLLGGLAARLLIPGSSLITASLWDFFTTSTIGQNLRIQVRGQRMVEDVAQAVEPGRVQSPGLLLRTMLAVALTDGRLGNRELSLYSHVLERFDRAEADLLGQAPDLKWKEVAAELAGVSSPEERLTLYRSAFSMAVIGGKASRKKRSRVEQIAGLYDLPFDKKEFQAQADLFEEPRPARTILLLTLLLFGLMSAILFVCILAAVSPFAYYWLTTPR